MDKWGHHPAVYALEPVNEPMWGSDLDVLKQFYRDARDIIRSVNPEVTFTFHDSFHYDAGTWNDLFADDDHENVVLDTHFYQAWWGEDSYGNLQHYCDGYEGSLKWTADQLKYDVWVGEWALATDVCALWLGGFNDANTTAQYECEYVDCPKPYLPDDTAVDFDRTVTEDLGPFGTGFSDGMTQATIRNGKCAKDSTFFSDEQVKQLGGCAIRAFDDAVQGHFLWTFRNELEDRWNYVTAFDKGWLNANNEYPSSSEFLQ